MENLDWTKIKQAAMAHEWIAVAVAIWLLALALYVIFQIWFGYSWTGRWRAAALVPVVVLGVLGLIFFLVGQVDNPEPPAWVMGLLGLAELFGPLVGVIYLLIVAIAHRKSRRRATAKVGD
jgi:hypothetical protein